MAHRGVRHPLLLQGIGVIDLCFASMTLSSSLLILLGEPEDSPVCNVLGPAFEFTNFMLWTSIAVLAHYSVARLFNRNVNRTQMLYRYLFSSLAAAAVLTIATTASMYWWKVGHHKNGYQLVHGVCAVSGSGNVVITCCEVNSLCVCTVHLYLLLSDSFFLHCCLCHTLTLSR